MADLMKRGTRWGTRKLRSHASVTVTYSRGVLSTSVPAVIGSTVLSLSDGMGGTRIERTDRTYTIAAADLAAFGDPEPGDRVAETDDAGTTRTYEVLPYGGTEPCWRWADGYHKMLMIHCKQVA